MKQVKTVASATNFKAINVGKLNEVSDYVLELGPDVKIPGKVFGGQALVQQAAISHSRCSNLAPKQAFFTLTRHTKSSTFS